MCDTIGPILVEEIDESNEWLVGKLDGDGFIFDDDSLQWSIVAKACGVGESTYNDGSKSKGSISEPTHEVSKKMASSSTLIQLVDEEGDEYILDEPDEEDFADYNLEDIVENGDQDNFGDDLLFIGHLFS